jgi:hypothetical protein
MFEQLSKKEQLIYLSGLFEGEGWFGINKRKEGWTPSAVLEVQMTDEEVVTLFQRYLKTNRNIRKTRKKKKEYYKDTYRFCIKGYRALHLMEEMLPYLCRRRKEQYYAVVKSIGNGPKNWSPPLSKQTKDKTSNVRCTTHARRKDANRGDSLRG